MKRVSNEVYDIVWTTKTGPNDATRVVWALAHRLDEYFFFSFFLKNINSCILHIDAINYGNGRQRPQKLANSKCFFT